MRSALLVSSMILAALSATKAQSKDIGPLPYLITCVANGVQGRETHVVFGHHEVRDAQNKGVIGTETFLTVTVTKNGKIVTSQGFRGGDINDRRKASGTGFDVTGMTSSDLERVGAPQNIESAEVGFSDAGGDEAKFEWELTHLSIAKKVIEGAFDCRAFLPR